MSSDLRVPFATYEAADNLIDKLRALFVRLEPVIWEAYDEAEREIETTLARLTRGQRAAYAVEQLQMEVGNGGFDQYFFNSAGALAREALEGLRLLQLDRFASIAQQVFAQLPDGNVPRVRHVRQQLLDEGLSQRLEESDFDSQWYGSYAGVEEISKAVLAYVDGHADEFFFDHP